MIEKKLLSLCLKDHTAILTLLQRDIRPEYFSTEETATFYKILKWFYVSYKQTPTLDALVIAVKQSTLSDNMKSIMPTLFTELQIQTTLEPISFLIEALLNQYKDREIRNTLTQVVDNLNSNKTAEVVAALRKKLTYLENVGVVNNNEGDYRASVAQRIAMYKENKGKSLIGLTYGFPSLDNTTGGHLPGELWVVMGKTKVGKSTLLLNMSNNAWRKGKNVLYVSAEVKKSPLERRLDSINTDLSSACIKRGMLSPDQEIYYEHRLRDMEKATGAYYIVDRPGISPSAIQAKIQELKLKMNLDLVVVDYISILNPSDGRASDAHWQQISSIAKELRDIASVEGVPILTAQQATDDGRTAHSRDIERHLDLLLEIEIENEDMKQMSPICPIKACIKLSRDSAVNTFTLQAIFDKYIITEPLVVN